MRDLKQYNQAYYQRNKEKLKARAAERRRRCADAIRVQQKAYRLKHREKLLKYKRDHLDKLLAEKRAWALKNKAHVSRYLREWKRQHPQKVALAEREREARKRATRAGFTLAQWYALKAAYKFRCAYCGLKKLLTQDHVIPLVRGGEHSLENIVPACRSCNSRKGKKEPPILFNH